MQIALQLKPLVCHERQIIKTFASNPWKFDALAIALNYFFSIFTEEPQWCLNLSVFYLETEKHRKDRMWGDMDWSVWESFKALTKKKENMTFWNGNGRNPKKKHLYILNVILFSLCFSWVSNPATLQFASIKWKSFQ